MATRLSHRHWQRGRGPCDPVASSCWTPEPRFYWSATPSKNGDGVLVVDSLGVMFNGAGHDVREFVRPANLTELHYLRLVRGPE